MRSLVQLSETWPCHILHVDRVKYGSKEELLGGAF